MQKILALSGMALLAAGAQTAHSRTAVPSSETAKKAAPKPAALIKGRVTLPDGKAGVGARVYATWITGMGEPKFQRMAVNDRGEFQETFPGITSGRLLVLTAFASGKGLCRHLLQVEPKAAFAPLELKLQPLVSLSGTLIHSDGRPVSNTALHVQTLAAILRLENSNPVAHNETGLLRNETNVPTSLLPAEDLKAYFNAKTDANGRFTFTALPGSAAAGIGVGDGLTLSPGSAAPVLLLSGENNNAGVLVATRPGRVKIRITDRDGKPVGNVPIGVTSADVALRALQFSRRMRFQESLGAGIVRAATDAQVSTNVQGEAETPGLFPGEYQLFVQGHSSRFRIEEGQTGKPIILALRQGPLKGRVLDANGKPAAHVPVALHASLNEFGAFQNLMTNDMAVDSNVTAQFQTVNVNKLGKPVVTDAEGRFTLPNFAWGVESVTVSAERGDSFAEWTGAPDKIGSEISLHLKAAALIPVTGRLLDAHRQPITNAAFKTLHWQSTPRIVWLMNARTGKADAEGRFQLAGLERGESFSLVTASLNGNGDSKQEFESPRFVAQGAGTVQDLGDIIVHPAHDGEDDIATLYGLNGSREILPELSGALPNPSPTDLEAAKQALVRYRAALKTLDLEAIRHSASTASLGWSENKAAFMRNTAFGAYAGESSPSVLLPLRFVPRFALAQLLPGTLSQNSASGDASDSAMRNAAHELSQNQKLVFLAERHGGTLALAGVLRKEGNDWRILSIPAGSVPADLFLMDDAQELSAASGFTRAAPVLDAAGLDSARQTGEQYLRVWAQGRHAPMLTLTSPLSAFFTSDMAAFAKSFAKRADGGLCPLAPEAPIRLQSMEGLTLWEQEWLARLSHIVAARAVSGAKDHLSGEAALAEFAKRGDLTALRYNDGERAFAMILARYDGKWQVVEPALPL